MKILIAVPSKSRSATIQKLTLSWLSKTKLDYRVFIEPQEYGKYVKTMGNGRLVLLGANDKGLGYSKESIKDYAIKNGYDLIFKVDDDMLGWWGRSRRRSDSVSHEVFIELLKDCEEQFLKHPEVKAIGFSYAWQMFDKDKWTGINQRLQSCYLTRTQDFHADALISVFEDFAAFLAIRVQNGVTLRYGFAGMDIEPVGKNPGGHQNFNRKERAVAEIEQLRKLYPALKFRKVTGKDWDIEPDMRDVFLRGKQQK